MSRCPTCGQEAGEPLIAILRDKGFIPMEHCEINAIYFGRITPCVGLPVYRQCHICKVGKALGTWESKRGNYTFTPKGGTHES